MKTRSKVLIAAAAAALAALILFAANSIHISLLGQTHLHSYHILWDHTEEDYDARFLVAESDGTYTAAVYQKTALGWRRMLSYSDRNAAVLSLTLYEKGQEDIAHMRETVFCLVAAEPETLDRMRASAGSGESLEINCTAQTLAGSHGDVRLLFGVSNSSFGSDDLILAAE